MAIQRTLTDDDAATGGTWSPSGNAGGSGGAPPPPGSGNILTPLFADINWAYTEPEPVGACTGFEVAIFNGADPDTGILAVPIIKIPDPTARRYVGLVTLRSQILLAAAVRAVYGIDQVSAWCPASAGATFTPETVVVGANSGYRKLSDGTMIQWASVPGVGNATVAVAFPVPFPNTCFQVVVSPDGGSASVAAGTQSLTPTGFSLNNSGALEVRTWRYLAVGY